MIIPSFYYNPPIGQQAGRIQLDNNSFRLADSKIRTVFQENSEKGITLVEHEEARGKTIHMTPFGQGTIGIPTKEKIDEIKRKQREQSVELYAEKAKKLQENPKDVEATDLFLSNRYLLDPDYAMSYYRVDGVVFSAKQADVIRDTLHKSVPSTQEYLNYGDYARMGMVEGAINTYAKEQLTDDQGDYVRRFAKEYHDQLIENESARLQAANVSVHDSLPEYDNETLKYYNRFTSSDEDIKRMNRDLESYKNALASAIDEKIKNQFRYNIIATEEGIKKGIFWKNRSASNTEVTGALREMFAGTDFDDKEQTKQTMVQYKNIIKPIAGLQGMAHLYSHIAWKEEKAYEFIDLLKAVAAGANTAEENGKV